MGYTLVVLQVDRRAREPETVGESTCTSKPTQAEGQNMHKPHWRTVASWQL